MTSTKESGDGYRLFPLALRVTGRPCLVVGGGAVAARKVASLLEAGALVEVVAPELGPELRVLRRSDPPWRWMAKVFTPSDIAGCLLVIAATDDRRVNRRVAEAARERGALVNVVDAPEDSDFFVPSVVRRGPLQLAITTSGLAPAVSARLRRRLEELFPEEWGDAVALIGQARDKARGSGLGDESRRALARELAALDIERLLAQGGLELVKEAVQACTSPYWA